MSRRLTRPPSTNINDPVKWNFDYRFYFRKMGTSRGSKSDWRAKAAENAGKGTAKRKRGRPGTDPRTVASKERDLAKKAKVASIQKAREAKILRKNIDEMCASLRQNKGRIRTYEENCMFLHVFLKEYESAMDVQGAASVNIGEVTAAAALMTGFSRDCATELRAHFMKTNEVLVTDSSTRGRGSPHYVDNARQITPRELLDIEAFIARCHEEGESVTARKIVKNLQDLRTERGLEQKTITRRAVRYALHNFLDYHFGKVKKKKCQSDPDRVLVIRTFIRDWAEKLKEEAEEDSDLILVYTDESYMHQNHAPSGPWLKKEKKTKSGMKEEQRINRGGKGKRLIILHAITKDGPLITLDENDLPLDDLKDNWGKHDVPKPNKEGLSAENLWQASSHTGDYHDNMDSENFHRWVEGKLVRAFQAKYPGKRMCLVMDNAPYHHARGIPSLGTIVSKADCLKHLRGEVTPGAGVGAIPLPMTDRRWKVLSKDDEFVGRPKPAFFSVDVSDDFLQRASAKHPRVPSLDEMKLGYAEALAADPLKRELLRCKIEATMERLGYCILWTPAYCPDLQPIELFWAAGKNHAADHYRNGQTMREAIEKLREGWYGAIFPTKYQPGKTGVDCSKLVATAIKHANIRIERDDFLSREPSIT